MKKCISIVLTVVLCLVMAVSASAADVTANVGGYSGVEFSDGYIGFCIDATLKGADNGQNFTKSDSTNSATNNNTQADVSQQLKALFVVNFNEMFVADGDGGYELDGLKVDSSIQSAVWNITDGRYVWGESKTFAEAAKSYDGAEIPDEGYSLQLDNGDVVTFSFIVVEPHEEGYQAFFALKISISDEPTHTHDYDDEWSADDENHWHECECGDKADEDEHTLTEADCKNPSECSVCGKVVGGTNSENHTGETVVKNQKSATETEAGYTGDIHCADCDELLESGEIIAPTHTHDYDDEWTIDDENHWHECECGDKADEDEHTLTEADCKNPSECSVCGKVVGGTNPENHTGETVVKNQKSATETEAGYTGDIHCADCDELLESGEIIAPTHTHDYDDEWSADDENHWHECDCGDKADEDEHTLTEADCKNPSECSVCGKVVGGTNPENHTGETVVKNQKSATETEAGYTGDIHCADCDEFLESGEIIAPDHTHDYDDEWTADDENHWHECDCGDKADEDEHSFFLGTCSVCGYVKSPEIPDGLLETCGNIVLGIVDSLSEADLGAIDFGAIDFSDIDFGAIDFGDIDFGNISFGGEDNGEDDEVNEEIPDTGSDSTVVWAFALFVINACAVAVMVIRRKKHCINHK